MNSRIPILLFVALIFMGQTCKRKSNPVKEDVLAYDKYEFNSLKIIQDKSDKQVISIRIIFEGGLTNYNAEFDGAEFLAMQWISQGGSLNLSPANFRQKLDAAGAVITTDIATDHSAITLKCLREKFKEAFGIFSSLVLHPSFPDDSFDKLKEVSRKQLIKESSQPGIVAQKRSREIYFLDTPFSRSAYGNEYSLAHLNASQVKRWYFDSMLVKSRLLFVVTGFSDQEKLVQEMLYSFDAIPSGAAHPPVSSLALKLDENHLEEVYQSGTTSILRALIPAPVFVSPDAPAMQIALQIFHKHISSILSKQYVFSLPPSAGYSENPLGYISINCETQWPGDWARIIMNEIAYCNREGFNENEVRMAQHLLLTDYYLNMESSERASAAIGSASGAGDWKAPLFYPLWISKINTAEVNQVFRKYCTSVAWTCVGDTTGLNRQNFLQPLH